LQRSKSKILSIIRQIVTSHSWLKPNLGIEHPRPFGVTFPSWSIVIHNTLLQLYIKASGSFIAFSLFVPRNAQLLSGFDADKYIYLSKKIFNVI